MALVEGVSDLTVVLFIVVVSALLWMVKMSYDLRALIVRRGRAIESKVAFLEGKAVLMRREVVDLHKSLHSKMDAGEFEKRMDGLIELVKGRKKETHKHKDAH
ncbi:MAG: hypothetical protein V1787_01225 [Candidatus Micrarchaeota archaeon]